MHLLTQTHTHTHTHSCHTNAHTRSAVMLCTKWHKSTYTPTQTESGRERREGRGEGETHCRGRACSHMQNLRASPKGTRSRKTANLRASLRRLVMPPTPCLPSSPTPSLATPCFESACHCLMCPLISTLELLQQRQQRQHPSLVGAFAFSIPSHQKFIKFFSVGVAFFLAFFAKYFIGSC